MFVSTQLKAADVEDSKATVEAECKLKGSTEIPEWVPKLNKYNGQTLAIEIGRTTASIVSDDVKKISGKGLLSIPTETYGFEGLGEEGKLTLASAGLLIGAKTGIVYLTAKGKNPKFPSDHSTYRAEFSCKNKSAGKVAAFLELCTDAPVFKKDVSCKLRPDASNNNGGDLPEVFSFKSKGKGIEISYEGESDPSDTFTGTYDFFSNEHPPKNSTIKLIEYCYFNIHGVKHAPFSSLRVSGPLAKKGQGFASIPQSGSDGGASWPYDCK